jgi:hypothetical protein
MAYRTLIGLVRRPSAPKIALVTRQMPPHFLRRHHGKGRTGRMKYTNSQGSKYKKVRIQLSCRGGVWAQSITKYVFYFVLQSLSVSNSALKLSFRF